jgi:hypothetical protein
MCKYMEVVMLKDKSDFINNRPCDEGIKIRTFRHHSVNNSVDHLDRYGICACRILTDCRTRILTGRKPMVEVSA